MKYDEFVIVFLFYYIICSFIRLADYLIVNTMHVLAVNSVSTLLNYLTEQLQNTPALAEIQQYNQVRLQITLSMNSASAKCS